MKKLLLSTLFTTAFLLGIGQPIFINEINYDPPGTDADEAVEIAGPAGTDLTGYSLELYNGNGGVVYNTIPLSGIIPAQDNGYGTLNFFTPGLQNGAPDGIALIDDVGTVLQFLSYEGSLLATDGTAIGLTSIDIGISQSSGDPLQLIGVGTSYSDFTWTNQTETRGFVNTNQSFGGVLPPTVSYDIVSQTVSEAAGTITVNINIANEDANPTSVDVVLGVSTATSGGVDFSYSSPTTVTFPGGSNAQQSVSIVIVDDAIQETSEDIVLELQNVTNNGVVGSNASHTITITDNDAPIIPACTEIFFSEYIEGSGFNKAVEIYNPTTQVIDLSNYEVRLYGNGSATPTATYSPSGVLVPGDVFVIANSQAIQGILQYADATSNVTNFNGDDALELYNLSGGSTADVIGEIGIDPGTEWIVGTGSTLNNTLVRMSSVDAGTSVWTGVGDSQWDVYPLDDSLHIGSHQNTGCSTSLPLTAYPTLSTDTICIGDTLYFYNNTFGGMAPYNVGWDFGDGNTSNLDNPYHVYSSGGLYTVTLGIIDSSPSADDSTFTVFVNSLPTVTAISDTIICVGGTATLEATGSDGATPYTFDWSDGSTGAITSVMPTSLTTYYVMITDSNGCKNYSSNLTVDLYQPLTAGVSSNPTIICSGETVNILATASGGLAPYSYTWLPTGTGSTTSDTPIADSTYTVIVSDACESPNDTASVMVTVNLATADFTNTGEPSVSFTDNSIGNVATYLWDFGDGNTSASANPTNTYIANGTYTVCLTITTTEGCVDSVCQAVQISGIGINEKSLDQISIYPNPVSGNSITISNSNKEKLSISITNIIGQNVWSGTVTNTQVIELPNLNNGNYFVKISSSSRSTTKKLIVQ